MTERRHRPVGLTRDAGWQIGVRRTLAVEIEPAWELLISPAGQRLWLGEMAGQGLSAGLAYRLDDGTAGRVTVFKPHSHLRLSWHPPAWPGPSIIQVRTLPGRAGTTIAFHQEHLPGQAEREERRAHFTQALDRLEAELGGAR